MKKYWNYIRLVLILVILISLMSFANYRHALKNIHAIAVEVIPFEEIFVTEAEVQNLLFQEPIEQVNLHSLNLSELEQLLITHDMIKGAQVYYDIDGNLGIEVKQRKPLLRFLDGGFQYLDEEGEIMPLSKNYSARVPVAFGFNSEDIQQLYPLVKAVENDDFLKQHIVGFSRNKYGVNLSLRETDFKVLFGDIHQIELKLNNLKAFYLKAQKDNKLTAYKQVDLRFGNQVVCTKI